MPSVFEALGKELPHQQREASVLCLGRNSTAELYRMVVASVDLSDLFGSG